MGISGCTGAERIIADGPDGIMLSNGPGDPDVHRSLPSSKAYDTDILFLPSAWASAYALAVGADTFKMKYGHREAIPVKDLKTGRVLYFLPDHGYVVDN